jgi:hypothetical protein
MVGQQQNAKITDFSAGWRGAGTQKIPRVGRSDDSEVGEISEKILCKKISQLKKLTKFHHCLEPDLH